MTNRELLKELKALRLELTALKAELAELKARPNVENHHYHYHPAPAVSSPPVTIPQPIPSILYPPSQPTIIWGNTAVRHSDTKPFTVTF